MARWSCWGHDACYAPLSGFSADKTGQLRLPGPFERDHLLGPRTAEGALDGTWGMIVPAGASLRRSRRQGAVRKAPRPVPRAS